VFNVWKTRELALHSTQRLKWIRKKSGKYTINPYTQAKIPDTQTKGRLYRTWVSITNLAPANLRSWIKITPLKQMLINTLQQPELLCDKPGNTNA